MIGMAFFTFRKICIFTFVSMLYVYSFSTASAHTISTPDKKQTLISQEVQQSLYIPLSADFMERALNVFTVAYSAGVAFPPIAGHLQTEIASDIEKDHTLSAILQANHFTSSSFLKELTCFLFTYSAMQNPSLPLHPLPRNITLIRSKQHLPPTLIAAMEKVRARAQ